MTRSGGQQVADRAVDRDRIGRGHDRPEMEATVLSGLERCTDCRAVEIRALHIIEAILIRRPHLDDSARHRRAIYGRDSPLYQ